MDLAFIGCAHIHTQDFVERLRRRRDVEDFRWNVDVQLVWDHDRSRAEGTVTALGNQGRATSDLDEVLSNPTIDAVVIAAENVRHTDLIAACARAGKHIFVDKPLALTAVDAYALAREIDQRGIIFQTGYLRRAEPAARFLRGAIQVAGSWIDRAAPLVIEIAGTNGHAHFAHGQLYYSSDHVAGADGRTPLTDLPPALPHAFDLYLDALLGVPECPLVSVWEAADRVAMMEAMYNAAASSSWVSPTRLTM